MARSISELLKHLAAEAEADEKADRDAAAIKHLEELQANAQAAPALSDEDRELLEWARGLRADLEREREQENDDSAGDGDEKRPKKKREKNDDPPAAKRTRPGRKSGQAYDWDVDDGGNVRRLDFGKIYSGDDEPDEVELPDDDDELEDTEDAA